MCRKSGMECRLKTTAPRSLLPSGVITGPQHIPSTRSHPPFSPGHPTSFKLPISRELRTEPRHLRRSSFRPYLQFPSATAVVPLLLETSTSSFPAICATPHIPAYRLSRTGLLTPARHMRRGLAWRLPSTARMLSLHLPKPVCERGQLWSVSSRHPQIILAAAQHRPCRA